MHTPEVKRVYHDCNIHILDKWPKYSPELNPQENVWPESEKRLREKEGDGGESFEEFQKLVVESIKEYSGATKLVGGMAKRIQECLDSKGQFINH